MVGPDQVMLGPSPSFGRRQVESWKFDRRGHVSCVFARLRFWRETGAAPYKGVARLSEAGDPSAAMLKSLLSNPIFQAVLGFLMGGYMRAVGATMRWTQVNRAAIEPFWTPGAGGRVIVCIWHGRFAQVHKMWRFAPDIPRPRMLISQSRDGGIVAQAASMVRSEVVRGSAGKPGKRSKGGVEAMLSMARYLEDGGVIAVTPDGPRGPRMRAKRGPVHLAKNAGVPLMPVAWSSANRIFFKDSWDRFMLPLPFGKGVRVWGNPIAPPAPNADDNEIEVVRLQLEAEMNRVAAEADRLAGVPPIEPAPLRGEITPEAAETAATSS